MFAAISDVLWQAIIAGAVTIVLGWMQMKTRDTIKQTAGNAAVRAEIVAAKVTEVKKDLAKSDDATTKKLEAIGNTTDAVHTLVNSNMGVQLQLNATLARRVAELTKSPLDFEVADKADKMLAEHQAKQATVDAVKAVAR